jgi:membrane fusion protein (multidrug efflux system)
MTVKKKRKLITVIIVSSVLLAFVILFAIRIAGSKLFAGKETEETTAYPVSAAVVKPGKIYDTLTYTGDVHAEKEALIYSLVQARVTKYNYKEGDTVNKGDALVILDREQTWNKYKPVIVKAPVSGIVAVNYLDIGEVATTETALSLVVGGEGVNVYIQVPDKELSQIKTGMKAELTVPTAPGKTYRGIVERVSPVIERTTRTSQVEIKITDSDGSLRSGMFGDIIIVIDEKTNVLLIPLDSVLYEKEGRQGPYCFVVENNIVKKRTLVIGIVQTDIVEVVSGLKVGDKVVTLGKENLSDGSTIKIIESF